MKKPIFETSTLGMMSPDLVAEHNRQVRASASPKMQSVMDEVQAAVDEENASLDAQFTGETKLRAWAKDLFGVNLDVSEIEFLRDRLKDLPNNGVFSFTPAKAKSPVTIYKTAFGVVDRLDRYIFTLEKTIVDLSNKPVQQLPKEQFTDVSFFGLIKLAFKRLINRSK